MFQLYNTNQKMTFDSSVVTTVTCTAQYTLTLQKYDWSPTINSSIPRHTMNSSVTTGFLLQDGQSVVLMETDDGYAICSYEGSEFIQMFNFNLLPQASPGNFGLQTFNADGVLTYCALTSRVLTPVGHISHFDSDNNQLFSSSILDRLVIMPLTVTSSHSLFHGCGLSVTYAILKRVGSTLVLTSRYTNEICHGAINTPQTQVGTFGISALMLDSNKL